MKFIDFFAGIGGFRLGLERTRLHQCVASCEIEDGPTSVVRDQFAYVPHWRDICEVQAKDLPRASLWTAGFPCQDVSAAGPRLSLAAPRSGLVWEVLRLLREGLSIGRAPTWVLLENVPGALVRGRGWGDLPRALSQIGYLGAWRVLDARGFGVPQHRSRVFLLARLARARGPHPGFVLLQSPSLHWDAQKERSGKPTVVARTCTRISGGNSGATQTLVVAVTSTTTREGLRHQPTAETFVYGVGVHVGVTGRLMTSLKQVCVPTGRRTTHPFVRRLSLLEIERVMGFPDHWTKAGGSDVRRRRMLGNAVVPAVVQWIGERLPK